MPRRLPRLALLTFTLLSAACWPKKDPSTSPEAIAAAAKAKADSIAAAQAEAARVAEAARAEAAGLRVVMNRCPKIEFGRLTGALSWGGINSGVISSRRRRGIA